MSRVPMVEYCWALSIPSRTHLLRKGKESKIDWQWRGSSYHSVSGSCCISTIFPTIVRQHLRLWITGLTTTRSICMSCTSPDAVWLLRLGRPDSCTESFQGLTSRRNEMTPQQKWRGIWNMHMYIHTCPTNQNTPDMNLLHITKRITSIKKKWFITQRITCGRICSIASTLGQDSK